MNLLSKINSPNDIKNLSDKELVTLSQQIRDEIINTVSNNGGHLASNLGVVELTVALHKIFDSPVDSIVFDVSHQCYTHKLLTGRYNEFSTLRTNGGITGFTNPDESIHDIYKNGHSSTSISAALGIATAKKLNNDNSYTVAVIGDGSLSSGLAYEGLNNAGHSNTKLIIIINDNKMSISKNVGGISRHLTVIRSSKSYHTFKGRFERILLTIPLIGRPLRNGLFKTKKFFKNMFYNSNIFEDMGFNYFGPIDGHNLKKLQHVLQSCKISGRPAVVHIKTKKGYGYSPALDDPTLYHSTSNFEIESGVESADSESFSSKFGDYLVEFSKNNKNICAVTAAMCDGTGLNGFKNAFKDRYFDVGIAEEHAVTFSSGLAKMGKIPVFAVYSSFLQRTYDQLIHDCSLQKCQLILAVDRAGIVGMDGETHQGIYDISFLRSIPNIQIFCPTTYGDLSIALERSIEYKTGVSAIRFPRGSEPTEHFDLTSTYNDFDIYGNKNSKTIIISYGRVFHSVLSNVSEKNLDVKLIKLNKIFPIDFSKLCEHLKECNKLIIFEETVYSGSISEYISLNCGIKVYPHTLPDGFIPHNDVKTSLENYGLSKEEIYKSIIKEL